MGDRRNIQFPVLGNMFKHKHLVLDQRNINAAKRYFGVVSEQETRRNDSNIPAINRHALIALLDLPQLAGSDLT